MDGKNVQQIPLCQGKAMVSSRFSFESAIDLNPPGPGFADGRDARILAISESEKRKADCVLSSVVLLKLQQYMILKFDVKKLETRNESEKQKTKNP